MDKVLFYPNVYFFFILIGRNGSGKSNILRLLELLVAAADGKFSRYVQSTGGMESIVWDGHLSSVQKGEKDHPFKLLERDGNRAVVFDEDEHRLNPPDESIRQDETLLNVAPKHVPPNWIKIPKLMQEFETWLRESNDLHPVVLAAKAHIRLARIHPFVDGNGRTCRLLVNYILMQHGFSPDISSNTGNPGVNV